MMEQNGLESAIDREEALEKELVALREKIAELEAEEIRLKLHAEYEQSDVDELEGRTLKSAFYTLIGKKQEKLDQEYYEADEAKSQYQAVVAELAAARKELNRAEYALRQFRRSQKEEKQAFEALLASVKERFDSLSPNVQKEFLRLEQDLKMHTEQQELILLAIEEGKKALPLAEYVVEAWEEVREYDRQDNIFAEYERLDEAKERQKMLNLQLKRFSDALMKIVLGNLKSDFTDKGELGSPIKGSYRYETRSILSVRNLENAISPVLGELKELFMLRREKEEQIKARIKNMIGEEGSF